MVKQINMSEFNEKIEGKKKFVVDFYADWCGPCKQMAPLFEELSEKHSDVDFCKMNIDENMEIAKKYKVMSIPNICFFENGDLKDRIIGVADISELEAKL